MDKANRQAHHARLMQYWQDSLTNKRLRNVKPLSFEVPQEYDSAKLVFWLGTGLVKDERLYLFDEMKSGCLWGVIFVPFLALLIFTTTVYFTSNESLLGVNYSIYALACLLICIASCSILFLAKPRILEVFDRRTGTLYIFDTQKKIHIPHNFYETYFWVNTRNLQGTESVSLLYRPMIWHEDGSIEWEDKKQYAVGNGTIQDKVALWCWYGICTFMNKDRDFNEKELAEFTKREADYKKKRYRLKGLRLEDGTVETL